MTKHDLLGYLVTTQSVTPYDVAQMFGIDYAAAAMALLRLARQGLAHRTLDRHSGSYWYSPSERGNDRLVYFEQGEHAMKRQKLHSGIYHCPTCFVEFDLVAEDNLKCDQCQGPLAKGSLDDVWDDDETDE